jgi:AhpD family alkylhydroperoxidase
MEMTMTPRLKDYAKAAASDGVKAMLALEAALARSGIEASLRHLVKVRASQINGCAHCLHMHCTEARRDGETEMRLYMLSAWRESPLYSARERAALGWTEALTLLPQTGAPDADYEPLRREFSESEQVELTLIIGAINVWNRLQVGFRASHPVDAEHVAAA